MEHPASALFLQGALQMKKRFPSTPTAGSTLGCNAPKEIALSHAQRRLVRVMQRVNFGEIRNLHVKEGEPLFRPSPDIVRSIRFGAENGPRPEMSNANFAVKQPVFELFEELRQLRNGCVLRIGIKHGLPLGVDVIGELGDENDQ